MKLKIFAKQNNNVEIINIMKIEIKMNKYYKSGYI